MLRLDLFLRFLLQYMVRRRGAFLHAFFWSEALYVVSTYISR